MEILQNKKVAIPVLAVLAILAIAGAWWGISRMPQSGGIRTTNIKGEAALEARASEDNSMLSQLSADELRNIIRERKVSLEAAESYQIENDIMLAKQALERAEAVLKTK